MSGPSDTSRADLPRGSGTAARQSRASALPASVERVLATPGQPLAPPRGVASRHDFGRIRIHADDAAAESAEALGAAAYSAGPHIVFGRGRYAPGTPHGERLLRHELAHSLHQTSAGSVRPGLAPEGSLPERRAEEFATDPGRAIDWRRWGQPWEVHAQRVSKPGTREFREERLGLGPDEYGPPVGVLEVRTGEEVEVAPATKPGEIVKDMIAFEYSGRLVGETRWLQFLWREIVVSSPSGTVAWSGSAPTASGELISFTTDPASPNWAVDARTLSDPFYETGRVAIKSAEQITTFDLPSPATLWVRKALASVEEATSATSTAHFDTYLVQNNHAIHHFPWSASWEFTASGDAGRIKYTVGSPGNVAGLPADLKKLLDSKYPKFSYVK